MASITPSLAAIIFLLVIRLLLSLYRTLRSPLLTVPGPWIARFTNLWYAVRMYQGQFEYDNVHLHEKHGPVVRYGPNRYSISSTEAAKAIYGHGHEFPKSSWYDAWANPSPTQWGIFTDRHVKRHAANRRQFQSMYSLSSLVHYESFVDECADLLHQRLAESSVKASVDLGHWLQCYAFDVIGMITYSKRLGFLNSGHDVGDVMQNLNNHVAYASLVGIYATLHPFFFKVRNWLAGKQGKGRQYILNFTKERMAEHQSQDQITESGTDPDRGHNSSPKTTDFLSKFYQKHTDNPDLFTSQHVLAGCTSNMVAGSDTTSITLSAIIYYLLRDADIMTKLREEIDTANQQGELSRSVTFEQSQKLPFLQAVIREALRMHPATGLPLERVVPANGAVLNNRHFPPGTIVGINAWVEHRNKTIFGDDADHFNPCRWLDSDRERLSLMNRHWMPFGLGSRTCLGRHISMLEISKLVPRLIRDFDMTLSESAHWSTRSYWFVKPDQFRVMIKPRVDNMPEGG